MSIRTADGLSLFDYRWSAQAPRLTVALIHGYGEHAGRYAHVAHAWNQRGISVVAADLRGHGQSAGVRGHVMRFEEYHQDVDAIISEARQKGGPVAIFGHSLGGLIVTHYLLAKGASGLLGAVISSPYLGLALAASPVKLFAGRVLSRLAPKFSIPSGLTGQDVTRDPELAKRYNEDPLNLKKANARWFTEAGRAQQEVLAQGSRLNIPLLLLYGGADKVAAADVTDTFARGLTMTDRTCERIPGYYHELVNEPKLDRELVIERMGTWLLDHVRA